MVLENHVQSVYVDPLPLYYFDRRFVMLKQFAQRLLKLLPPKTIVPILGGPLKGSWWTMHSSVHTCWRGAYERELTRQLRNIVKPGMTCYDCGANVGYFTLLFSSLVGPNGKVFSFEPLPANARHLRRHIGLNRCSNVTVIEVALADYDGKVKFSSNGSQSQMGPEGEIEVECRRMDSLGLPPPDVMKVDVEGAETLLVTGAEGTIERHLPAIFMSLHLAIPDAQALAAHLGSMGYEVAFSESAYELTALRNGPPTP